MLRFRSIVWFCARGWNLGKVCLCGKAASAKGMRVDFESAYSRIEIFSPALMKYRNFFKHHISDCGQHGDNIGCCLPLVDLFAAVALRALKRVNKTVWFECCYCTTTRFNNLFLHRLRKSHCIRHSNGQAVANSARLKVWPPLHQGIPKLSVVVCHKNLNKTKL